MSWQRSLSLYLKLSILFLFLPTESVVAVLDFILSFFFFFFIFKRQKSSSKEFLQYGRLQDTRWQQTKILLFHCTRSQFQAGQGLLWCYWPNAKNYWTLASGPVGGSIPSWTGSVVGFTSPMPQNVCFDWCSDDCTAQTLTKYLNTLSNPRKELMIVPRPSTFV